MFSFGNPLIPHLKNKPFIYLGLHVGGWVPCVWVEVGGQLVGVCFHSSLWGLGTESGHETCRQALLPAEPAHWLPFSLLMPHIDSLLMYYYHHCYYWHTENWTQCLTYARALPMSYMPDWGGSFFFCISSWNHFLFFLGCSMPLRMNGESSCSLSQLVRGIWVGRPYISSPEDT